MSIEFFKKLNWAFGLITAGLLFGVIFSAATGEIKDLDLWLHLRMGEYILQHGFVPSVDVLSASFLGKPWVDHEWLFQVLIHLVRQHWGFDGLIYMQAALVLVTCVLMFLLVYSKDRLLVLVPALYFVLQVYQTRFTIRPDIFSLFFIVVYFLILTIYLNRRWSAAALFLVQVVWSNMHGYSLWGVIIVLALVLAETARRRLRLPWEWNRAGRMTDEEYRRSFLVAAAVIAAMFFTPQGIEGVLYPLRTLAGLSGDSRIFFENIMELKPPLSWATALDLSRQLPFKALIFCSFVSFVFNRRKLNIGLLALWLAFLLFSLGAIRNITYFAFIAFLSIGYNFRELRFADIAPFRFNEPRLFYLSGVIASVCIAMQLVNYGSAVSAQGYYDFDRYQRKSEMLGVSCRNFPAKAVQFLIDNGIGGNFFNDFNSGAYLIGRAFPGVMVYMDGRTELRGGAFFKRYQKIWNDGDSKVFIEEARKYQLTGAFLNMSGGPAPAKALKMFAAMPEWKPVYFDHDALILLKDIPANQPAIARFGIDLAHWPARELDLLKVGAVKVFPYQNIRRAKALSDMGYTAPAMAEARAALSVAPVYEEAFKILGDGHMRNGAYREAFHCFRVAAAYSSGNPQYRRDLAQAYLFLNDVPHALEQAKEALEMDPDSVEGKFILAKSFVKNKQYDRGYDILRQILKDPKAASVFKRKAAALFNQVRAIKGK
jgi:tetratricopeptide (TPR) repeat protein